MDMNEWIKHNIGFWNFSVALFCIIPMMISFNMEWWIAFVTMMGFTALHTSIGFWKYYEEYQIYKFKISNLKQNGLKLKLKTVVFNQIFLL